MGMVLYGMYGMYGMYGITPLHPLHCKLASMLALYIPTSKCSSNESMTQQNKNKNHDPRLRVVTIILVCLV